MRPSDGDAGSAMGPPRKIRGRLRDARPRGMIPRTSSSVARQAFGDTLLLARPAYAPEPYVRGGGVHRLALPCRRPVTKAVVRRAQVRSTLDHLARDLHPRLARRVAPLRRIGPRVPGDAARFRRLVRMPRREVVRGPLPHVACRVVEPV